MTQKPSKLTSCLGGFQDLGRYNNKLMLILLEGKLENTNCSGRFLLEAEVHV